ncbi:MAG: proline dehydrogenase family protein [Candidatus Cyclobacteriaceae bacterium M2_1C_046]
MEPSDISFENTAVAYSHKSDKELQKAHLLFSVVNNPMMSNLATSAVKAGLWLRLPIKGLIKNTVFELFCGGENIEDSQETIKELANKSVGTILDYSVEGEGTEESFEATKNEILKTIDKAASSLNIPFSVFKPTGIASSDILEKVSAGSALNEGEKKAWENIQSRVNEICEYAHSKNVRVLIDAEDSWLQKAIDELVYSMMERYNKDEALIFNTYQMYRHEALNDLRNAHQRATMHRYYLGAKLVRGAYMEKERERAKEMGYKDPIQPNKEATDRDYNKALQFCIDNKQRVSVLNGSHNEYSNKFLAVLMEKHSMPKNDERVWYAQLYGMGDNISFNLAKEGYNVVKYVPYGPVKSVMPYLLRRAEENTSVAGQSSRELQMIRKEIERREKIKKK